MRYGAEIIGIPFTEVERDSMLDAVRKQLVSFRRLRQTGLLNSVPPAIKFDPTPVGWKNTVEQVPIRFSSYADVALPENRNGLAYLSVGELGALIRLGKLTSLVLTEFCLDRLKTHGPTLRCVITLTEELAREQARQADREIVAGAYRGPLHGIPYGIKDLFATKEHRTTLGAEPYREQRFEKDAAVVSRLREAGVVLVAKLTLGALAWGDVWYGGKTRNPWNIEKGSSGSSAGSAAAVSAGLVPFAIGTETWGSIVSPATRCGVTGLRPLVL